MNYLRTHEGDLCVSIVSKIEVLGYHQLKQVEKEFLNNFFYSIPILQLDTAVAEKAIELRQRKPMSLADSILAATALANNLPLFTDNIKDYAGIKGLKLISVADALKES
ncbi:MAG: type II toxin-antitoxin system VapC family toxin [Saprospiraceae bacterium]|nr:type II toxin-antitoxin system VapC family toxin [Saprospiraceae bacterium]MCF8252079.1 type II toxin-antitoxin system VapC family toxin [Saprospiraceae bacterium]MCF8281785.1 type II toxin-antitoxin system VapC family toxin [Bacteroidales bacterium]MCF8313722.1 type II toxin-antitoxin system VapC family toxin [Saprospiraceae bacterium]MCF8442429.1 type II toxin-antitoxin system VapC family toxin [Saprospiraceae bacterium]